MPGAPQVPTVMVPHGITDRFVGSESLGSAVENFLPSSQGSLRSIVGPIPFLPPTTTAGAPAQPVFTYYFGTAHGCFWAEVRNRELLFIHDDDAIRVFQGWSRTWGDGGLQGGDCLIGPSTRMPLVVEDLTPPPGPRAQTQWVATPNGVVIVPARGRAWFFDGEVCAPLGYGAEATPSAPTTLGPKTAAVPNDGGYSHDGTVDHLDFVNGRKGTVEVFPGVSGNTTGGEASPNSGNLLPGEYRAAVQFMDRWGNLSGLSARSAPIVFQQETAEDPPGTFLLVDKVLKHIAWTAIPTGPEHTVGRLLLVTKDLRQSGTQELFELNLDVAGGLFAFANIPDNVTTVIPDNIPDSWQVLPADATVPVPEFRYAVYAFGQLVIAGIEQDPAMVRVSLPGRWGTYEAQAFVRVPGKVTALAATQAGVLIFTETATFLLSDALEITTLATAIGCIAADTVRTLRNGTTIWLARQGFATFTDTTVSLASSGDLSRWTRRISMTAAMGATAIVDPNTGVYLCAVPEDGLRNNTLYSYDGQVFARHPGHRVRQFAVQPRTQNVLYAGQAHGVFRVGTITTTTAAWQEGLWVFNAANRSFDATARLSRIETAWLGAEDSLTRKNLSYAYVWAVESEGGAFTVSGMRDFRATAATLRTLTASGDAYAPPSVFNGTVLNTAQTYWNVAYPAWKRADLAILDAVTIQVRVDRTTDVTWEVLALGVALEVKPFAPTRVP